MTAEDTARRLSKVILDKVSSAYPGELVPWSDRQGPVSLLAVAGALRTSDVSQVVVDGVDLTRHQG